MDRRAWRTISVWEFRGCQAGKFLQLRRARLILGWVTVYG